MQRWAGTDEVPLHTGPSVVTVGNFDGVHRGHQEVLGRVVRAAREASCAAVAVTFDPHPAQVHRPAEAPPLLTGLTDRLELLAETGLDAVLLLRYTREFARTGPEEFVRDYLVRALGACRVVVGHDVRFGRDNAGDLSTMVDLGRRYGFDVEVVHDVVGPDDTAPPSGEGSGRTGTGTDQEIPPAVRAARWSSTGVRALLAAGDVRGAAHVLGRRHRVRGVVVHGDARGRGLGYPTANLGDVEGMVPADGVYAGWMTRPGRGTAEQDRLLPVAVSIGTNPTFDGQERRVEAHVPDRDDLDLYGEEVVVELVELLRPTLRFTSVEELVDQMAKDVARTRELLSGGAG